MKSLFNKTDVDYFLQRIGNLKHDSPAAWGQMDVAQMLAHCQKPLEIATGSTTVKGNFLIRLLFGKRARKKLSLPESFPKNLPTFPEAKIVEKRVFEEERKKLISLIDRFHQNGPAGVEGRFHPFFGDLSVQEWDSLQVKHLDHHLSQFNV